VRNALDADYQAMYGYPMPGRTFGLDISYSF
jgi:outer membrane cobalamin receptor